MPSPSLSIGNTGGPTAELSQHLLGTADGVAAGEPLFIYDNGSDVAIGSTTVAADGSWSADIVLGAAENSIVAAVPLPSGSLSSAPVLFDFVPVLSPPSNGALGGPVAKTLVRIGGDSHRATVVGQAASEVFVFSHPPGHARITGFDPVGPDHDVVRLPSSAFASVTDLLRNIHNEGHDAVLTLDAHHSITFANVTAHALTSHRDDFRL